MKLTQKGTPFRLILGLEYTPHMDSHLKDNIYFT